MMTWEQVGVIISLSSVILGFFYFLGEKLIQQLFKKSEKLESIKERHTKENMDRLESLMNKLRSDLADVENTIKDMNMTMLSYDSNNKRLIEALSSFAKETRSRIDAIEKSEIVSIGGGKFILKKRG